MGLALRVPSVWSRCDDTVTHMARRACLACRTEFREGFKSYGIEAVLDSCINFEAPFYWTISDWSREIARVFNASVKRECQVLRGWFAQFDGSRSELRTVASRVERLQDQILLGIYMDPASETQVRGVYGMCVV